MAATSFRVVTLTDGSINRIELKLQYINNNAKALASTITMKLANERGAVGLLSIEYSSDNDPVGSYTLDDTCWVNLVTSATTPITPQKSAIE